MLIIIKYSDFFLQVCISSLKLCLDDVFYTGLTVYTDLIKLNKAVHLCVSQQANFSLNVHPLNCDCFWFFFTANLTNFSNSCCYTLMSIIIPTLAVILVLSISLGTISSVMSLNFTDPLSFILAIGLAKWKNFFKRFNSQFKQILQKMFSMSQSTLTFNWSKHIFTCIKQRKA